MGIWSFFKKTKEKLSSQSFKNLKKSYPNTLIMVTLPVSQDSYTGLASEESKIATTANSIILRFEREKRNYVVK